MQNSLRILPTRSLINCVGHVGPATAGPGLKLLVKTHELLLFNIFLVIDSDVKVEL